MHSLIGLLGGTFDPIHKGHINIATALMQQLDFAQVQFIPCQRSPHREQPIANAEDRLAMIKLAIEPYDRFTVNTIEIKKSGPSYTINTLRSIHAEEPNKALCFILAMDAFAHFNQWHQWQEILSYCHLIVVNRPGFSLPEETELKQLLNDHRVKNPLELQQQTNGKIFVTTIPPFPASATQIRTALAKGNDTNTAAAQLQDGVLKYIQTHYVYNT